jgi:hypothetical protein
MQGPVAKLLIEFVTAAPCIPHVLVQFTNEEFFIAKKRSVTINLAQFVAIQKMAINAAISPMQTFPCSFCQFLFEIIFINGHHEESCCHSGCSEKPPYAGHIALVQVMSKALRVFGKFSIFQRRLHKVSNLRKLFKRSYEVQLIFRLATWRFQVFALSAGRLLLRRLR